MKYTWKDTISGMSHVFKAGSKAALCGKILKTKVRGSHDNFCRTCYRSYVRILREARN